MPRILHDEVSPLRTIVPSVRLIVDADCKDEVLILHCRGSFTLPQVEGLDAVIHVVRDTPARRVVLDLLDVEQVDSVGVGTLSILLKLCLARSIELLIVPSGAARQMLAASSLDHASQLAASVQDALQ